MPVTSRGRGLAAHLARLACAARPVPGDRDRGRRRLQPPSDAAAHHPGQLGTRVLGHAPIMIRTNDAAPSKPQNPSDTQLRRLPRGSAPGSLPRGTTVPRMPADDTTHDRSDPTWPGTWRGSWRPATVNERDLAWALYTLVSSVEPSLWGADSPAAVAEAERLRGDLTALIIDAGPDLCNDTPIARWAVAAATACVHFIAGGWRTVDAVEYNPTQYAAAVARWSNTLARVRDDIAPVVGALDH